MTAALELIGRCALQLRTLTNLKTMSMTLEREVCLLMCYHMSCKSCYCVLSHVIRQRGNQVKMAKLSDEQRNDAIGMLRNSSVNNVAQHFGVHRTTIYITD